MSSTTCAGTNKRGEPCAAPASAGSQYCWFHDPERREERAEARRAGGHARHGRTLGKTGGGGGSVVLRTVDDCLTLLEQEAAELLAMERSIPRARAVVALVSEAARLIVNHELEQRLIALEAAQHAKRRTV